MPPVWFRPARSVPVALALALAAGAVVTATPAVATPASPAASTPPVTTRMVAGTSGVTDPTGAVWSPDLPYAVGGLLTAVAGKVGGTTRPAAFGVTRSSAMAYRIPVTGQTETLTLGFVEPHATARRGERVFDVVAEGATVAKSVDIAAAVGAMRAYSVTVTVRVTDGYLDLGLVGRVGKPILSNLEVVSAGDPSPAGSTASSTTSPYLPETFGAVGDGVHDDTAALQKAFDTAPAGRPVVLTAGRTYAHAGVLHLRTRGLHVTGGGTLLATAEATSSVWIEADDVLLDGGIVLRTATTTRRWDAWEQMGLRIVGHSGVVVRSVTVDGSAAAGIYVGGATGFDLDHVTVQNTRADGIHMTAGSNNGLVLAPTVHNSGDDGVAVVSYSQDGAACHDIDVVAPTVLGTTWGRGLSVVGGTRVTETDIDVRDTSAAGVYIASEGNPWFTTATKQVLVSGGSITRANTDADVDHGAVLVMSGETGAVPNGVTVQRLAISATRSSASRNLGVITYGDVPVKVLFSAIAITGGPASAYGGNTPASAYRLVQVTKDGRPVPVGG